jgi:hypothetical protein
MTTTLAAPAVGARYRRLSTGRVWHVRCLAESGLIGLTEEFYGPECDVRGYVTAEELAAEYTPAL